MSQVQSLGKKSEGCSHMTCRCGEQFCYTCGQTAIKHEHICNSNYENRPNRDPR